MILDNEEKLLKYLAYVKVGADDPMSEKSQAFQEFVRLLTHAKEIIARMYQGDEVEKENPERLWRIKQNRQRKAIEQKRLQLEGKDYKTQLETKERVTKKQTKKRGIL